MTTRAAWTWPTLHDGQRTVLLDMLIHGDMSRAELARRTGMSRGSLTRLSRDLTALDLVEEGETDAPLGRGRPAERLRLRPEAAQFVGFKLTGEALYAAVTDLTGAILVTEEHPLESRAVEDVIELMGQVVDRQRETYERVAAVGVCLAGDVRQRRGMTEMVSSYFLGWGKVPIERLIRDRTGLPIAVANDVQALAAAHHWFGAGRGHRSMVLIGLGAGIGVGAVVNDELLQGSRGRAGKIGHLPVECSGPTCDRGHAGCVSAFVTIPAITRAAGTDSLDATFEAARSGDRRAHEALVAAARGLGAVGAYLINMFDPEKVIITGEGRAVAEYIPAELQDSLRSRLDPDAKPLQFDVQPFQFSDYAWAAAISAIQRLV